MEGRMISDKTIGRLSLYRRLLQNLVNENQRNIIPTNWPPWPVRLPLRFAGTS